MSSQDKIQRSILPIPDAQHVGLTTYDAKDPDTKFPPIEPLRPPKGAPNVLIVLIDDCRVRRLERFRRPHRHTPTQRAARQQRPEVQPLPHHRALLADAPGAADRAESPFGEHGRHLRARDLGARATRSVLPKNKAPLAMTLKLNGYSTAQFGKCHEVPVWETSPMGPFEPVAHRRRRVRVLLRLPRRRDQPVVSGDLRRHDADRAGQDARRGLSLHRGHDEQGDRVGAPAEGAHARQAVLHVFRARRHTRPAPCAQGMDRQVQGQVRPGLGQAARRDLCPSEEAGRDSAPMPSSPSGLPKSPPSTTCRRRSSRSSRARWRSTPGSSSTPTTTSAVCSTR